MEELSRQDYHKQVRDLAEEAASEHGHATEAGQEWIWETCDGHEWVIYTFYHFQVLQHSENSGYTLDNFGPEGVVEDGQLNTLSLAFGALYGDVMEAYGRLEASADDKGEKS